MHYVQSELTSEVIERLSSLYFVKDQRDLQRKYREATKWLAETIVEIEREGFRDKINEKSFWHHFARWAYLSVSLNSFSRSSSECTVHKAQLCVGRKKTPFAINAKL
jgi:hypothetical protein